MPCHLHRCIWDSRLLARSGQKKDPDQIGNRDVSKGVNFYSIPKEIALGKQLAQQVIASNRVIDDPIISEYVNRVCQNLARSSDARIPLNSTVIQGEQVNALSLPGGYLFVNTGLILTAGSEAELAGALAHEIGHIAARHGTRQATKQEIASLSTVPLIFVGGWAGYGARQAAGAMIPMTYLKFSRAFESEADLFGLEYMYKAGYDPNGLVDIFEKIDSMGQRKTGMVSKLFSDHPPTGDRIIAVQKDIQELLKGQPQYVVNTSEFEAVKDRLLALENARKVEPAEQNRPRLRRPPAPKLSKLSKSTGRPIV